MSHYLKHWMKKCAALLLAASLLCCRRKFSAQQQPGYTFKTQAELVLVNVTVRDRNGNLVRDLKPEDFTVLEDNKPQKVASFDIENTETTPVLPQVEQAEPADRNAEKSACHRRHPNPLPSAEQQAIKDRRLIILFFDLSSMQPDEIQRSVDAAQNYLDKQMQPADLVSIISAGQHHHRESGLHL